MKTLLLKSIPYVLSITCGAVLFLVSLHGIVDENWNAMFIEISSTLLAIPVVFLVYNYSDYKMSRRVKKTLADGIKYEVNAIVLKLIISLRKIIGVRNRLSWDTIQQMLSLRAPDFKSGIKILNNDLDDLQVYKAGLDDLVYKLANSRVLDDAQIQTLSLLAKELSHMINEQRYRGKSVALGEYLEKILSLIDDWFDSCESDALRNHQHFQLVMEQNNKTVRIK